MPKSMKGFGGWRDFLFAIVSALVFIVMFDQARRAGALIPSAVIGSLILLFWLAVEIKGRYFS